MDRGANLRIVERPGVCQAA